MLRYAYATFAVECEVPFVAHSIFVHFQGVNSTIAPLQTSPKCECTLGLITLSMQYSFALDEMILLICRNSIMTNVRLFSAAKVALTLCSTYMHMLFLAVSLKIIITIAHSTGQWFQCYN